MCETFTLLSIAAMSYWRISNYFYTIAWYIQCLKLRGHRQRFTSDSTAVVKM